jgi:hypothetical protein
MKSFIKHIELDSNPKLVYFCVSKFKEFFELDVSLTNPNFHIDLNLVLKIHFLKTGVETKNVF